MIAPTRHHTRDFIVNRPLIEAAAPVIPGTASQSARVTDDRSSVLSDLAEPSSSNPVTELPEFEMLAVERPE